MAELRHLGARVRACDVPALLRRYHADRDARDLEHLVRLHQPLARALARRHRRASVAGDDLEQAAYEGLVKAIHRFDPARGATFADYAVPTILGEVRRLCRELGWAVHVPRPVKERVQAMRAARDELAAEHGRQPRVHELAARLQWEVEAVAETLSAAASMVALPLHLPEGDDEADEERIGTFDPGYDRVDCRLAIEDALPALSDRERAVIRLRFAEELGFDEISQRLSLPRSQAAALLRGALARLAAMANATTTQPAPA